MWASHIHANLNGLRTDVPIVAATQADIASTLTDSHYVR
jgi:hypothetical protein